MQLNIIKMLKKLKYKLWFIYRWLIWIKDNFFDNPEIDVEMFGKNIFSIWKTENWEEIKCYKFGEWKEKILYFWGIHWNEVWTVKLMNKWINFLSSISLNKWEDSFSWQGNFSDKQIFVIPCLNIDWYKKALKNPDYFNGGIIWKTNFNNVDVNRNFPTKNWSEKTKLFASWKYFDISGWNKAGSESEIKALINLIEKEGIKTIYAYHNCWWTVMSNFTKSSDIKTKEYLINSPYRLFSEKEWNSLREWQKTGHWTVWWIENNIDFIEIETKTRWWSEWKQNKKALLNSLEL